MKKTKILYWIFTGLLAVLMLMSGIPDIIVIPDALAIFKHLGYPTYLIPFLGVAKVLGAVVFLIPGFSGPKKCAYAGFVFDLTGAMYSHISVDDPASAWMPIFIGYVIIALS